MNLILYVEVVTFHFDCTMNPCPRMVTLYSVQRRYVRAVRARLSLEWIMNHLFFTNDYIITGTRRAKTSLARERWTSKCHIWTRGSLPPTLREMHPVRHQVGNRAQKIILRLMQQHLMTMFFSAGPKLNPRRYKTQLRDFLSSCRTKRKPTPNDIYADTASYAAFTSPTAPYMGGAIPSYPSAADTLYMQVGVKT